MRDEVREYYGSTLLSSDDLQTNACRSGEKPPPYIREILSAIHDDVKSRYYGCGLVIPELIHGLNVLDLGCGAGRDCYLLSALVGEHGSVTGVDMTPQQLAVANKHIDYHTRVFGYSEANVRFLHGNIESINLPDLQDSAFDLIISNCVLNLCENKSPVLEAAYRLLKPGGELYFSDVYTDRRIPASIAADPVLYGECLGGALYWNDFINLAKKAGFADPRLVKDSPITIDNEDLLLKTGPVRFFSATYRLFRLDDLEPACEDYGQAVIYKGSIDHCPHEFSLDKHHVIPAGKVFPVCGNTWRMLHETRYRKHFDFIGSGQTHYGIFDGCGMSMPFSIDDPVITPGCC